MVSAFLYTIHLRQSAVVFALVAVYVAACGAPDFRCKPEHPDCFEHFGIEQPDAIDSGASSGGSSSGGESSGGSTDDADKDGILTVDEAKSCIKAAEKELPEEAKEEFPEMDKEDEKHLKKIAADGVITKEELAKTIKGAWEKYGPK